MTAIGSSVPGAAPVESECTMSSKRLLNAKETRHDENMNNSENGMTIKETDRVNACNTPFPAI